MQIHKLYDGKVTLRFDESRHTYYIDKQKAGGVTSVFNYAVAKPGLTYWAVDQAIEVLQKRLKPGIVYDEIDLDEILREAKAAHRRRLDNSASMGTRIHNWAESFMKGENPPLPHNEVLKDAVVRIKDFYDNNNIKPVLVERPLVSLEYKIAGTPDLVCEFNGKLTILDWKTGSGIYSSNPRQLGAYAKFYHEEFGQWPEQLMVINASVKGHIQGWHNSKPVESYWEAYKNAMNVAADELELKQDIKDNTYQI